MRLLWLLPSLIFFTNAFCSNPIPVGELPKEMIEEIMPEVEAELAKDPALQNDGRTHRFTKEYGYSFFCLEEGDRTYTAPPQFLQKLGEQVCQALGREPVAFTNVILSYYGEGFNLEPHIDIDDSTLSERDYYFDDRVYGVILEPDESGYLYFIRDDVNPMPALDCEPCYFVDEKVGTVFCLEGSLRHFPFFHGVTPVSNGRISVTFRTVQFAK